jgi:hypothetical protein
MTIIDTTSDTVTSQFVEEDINRPTGKLTDCQAPFRRRPTAGLKLLSFAIREPRGGCHVTFPARQYIPDRQRRCSGFSVMSQRLTGCSRSHPRGLCPRRWPEPIQWTVSLC